VDVTWRKATGMEMIFALGLLLDRERSAYFFCRSSVRPMASAAA
jgi:hypothetical protein